MDRPISTHVPAFLAARSYSRESMRQRGNLLDRFCDLTDDPPPPMLTAERVVAWWTAIGGLAAASRRSHLSAVRLFTAHLSTVGVLGADPTSGIALPRVGRPRPVTLSPDEVVALLRSIGNTRDRAMVALMAGCGLRAMEVSGIDVEDVDLGRGLLSVEGKGDLTRCLPMPTVTMECVSDYLEDRPARRGPLVRHHRGEDRLSRAGVQQRVTALLYSAGMKRCAFDGRSSHVLRRTCATRLLESGASIRDVQVILGHRHLSSTEHYIAMPDEARLRALVERGPLAAA